MRRPRRHGTTLLEMIVVVVVLGILSGVLFLVIAQGANAYIDLRSRSANAADAQQALELMSREIQEIRTAASADITAFTGTALTFNDINANNVAYAFSGTTLTRNSQTLLDRLQSFSFAYKKTDGTAASLVTDIWSIEIDMTLVRSDKTLTLRTRLFPRNFAPKLKTWSKT